VNSCFDYICDANDFSNTKILSNKYPKIISDGGSLGNTGNKFKGLASGASAIMMGRTLASTDESPVHLQEQIVNANSPENTNPNSQNIINIGYHRRAMPTKQKQLQFLL